MMYLIGNWKSNYTASEAEKWIEKVNQALPAIPENLELVICPAFNHFSLFKQNLHHHKLGGQTISPFPNGAYTGSVSAQMVADQINFVIVGHSERRTYFHETNQVVINQITQTLESNLIPIIAVDQENWHQQLSLVGKSDLEKCVVMYEPPEAISKPDGHIGIGEPAPVNDVVEAIEKIRNEFQTKATIYGGSIKSNNIAEYVSHPSIDGVLPGSASLDADEWVKMAQALISLE